MADEPIFRFISVRQAPVTLPQRRPPREGRVTASVDLHDAPQTDLQKRVKGSAKNGAEARRLAEVARGGGGVIDSLDVLDPSIQAALMWAQRRSAVAFRDLDISAEIKAATGQTIEALVESGGFGVARQRLGDSLTIEAALGESTAASPLAVDALKILQFLDLSSSGALHPDETATLADVLGASVVVVPAPARGDLGSEVKPPPTPPRAAAVEPIDLGPLRQRFDALKRTRDDLTLQLRKTSALTIVHDETVSALDRTEAAASERVTELARENQFLAAALRERAPELKSLIAVPPDPAVPGSQPATSTSARVAISRTTFERMQPDNLKTFQAVVGDEELGPIRAVALLDRELHSVSAALTLPGVQSTYVTFAGGYIDKTLLVGLAGPFVGLGAAAVAECQYQVGVADLLLVKQTLKAYELAEFAHVENALRGELREREHRRLELREETTAEETETERERERDLQSTERNEMQAEATRQLRTEAGVQAGLQVSGSYGPTVSFSASLNASFSTSVQESQRKATSFSREVTERTSERVRERVRGERRRRVLEQVEELNRHKIDNASAPDGHVRGIYRWLNKVYDAQVLNYGKRMMYEFVIPEPAAFLIYSLIENPPADTTLPPKPDPPMYYGTPLKPENLTRYNYQRYVAQYHITNAPPPPSEFKFVSHFDKLDGQQDPATFGRAAKVALPDDYEGTSAYVSRYYVFKKGEPHALGVVVGGRSEDVGSSWGSRYVNFAEPFRNEISMAYGGYGLRAFALGIDIFCSLTEEGLAKWQQKAYDAIVEGYQRMRGDYEEKLAASQIAQGIKIIGRNPLENRRTIQDELKKWAVMVLRGSPYLNFNSFLGSSEPALDVAKVCTNGKLIRFLENAFEWHNMSYVCYPYFWGRHARWSAALHFVDPDPDFAAFLKAGAARVQVPVRPGFETAIAHFCDTGAVPEGEATLVGGSMYVPIVAEISESLGKLDEGVPYPEGSRPWEVRVPTTLVVLQDLAEIPGIRDVLTGGVISLQPPS